MDTGRQVLNCLEDCLETERFDLDTEREKALGRECYAETYELSVRIAQIDRIREFLGGEFLDLVEVEEE